MKTKFSILGLATVAAMTISLAIAQNANAFVIVVAKATGNTVGQEADAIVWGLNPFEYPPGLLLDTILAGGLIYGGPEALGVFLLDQKVSSIPPFTAKDLLDNGYTPKQVDRIGADIKAFNERIKVKGPLALEDHDTEASIRVKLSKILPKASEEFLDVMSERLSLAAQSSQDTAVPGVSESSATSVDAPQSVPGDSDGASNSQFLAK